MFAAICCMLPLGVLFGLLQQVTVGQDGMCEPVDPSEAFVCVLLFIDFLLPAG